jgi:phosphopantothenoylcysteine synthetase/decarboxylase
MNILVTAGNTQTPIDRVRCVTNVFSGKTGARIAVRAADRGHRVTLVTSHPEALPLPLGIDVRTYHTFEELDRLMGELIPGGRFDAVVHAAAVNDFHVAGVYAPAAGTRFDPSTNTWTAETQATLIDASAGKVKSHHPELWLRLVRAPKLVDKVRREWAFRGVLVKFKLEVGVTETELLAVAERSRRESGADLMAANTFEARHEWAYLGNANGYERVPRDELADRIVAVLEETVPDYRPGA